MPGDEDDLGFTALDDNIVGDGTVDGQTKPLDTMLESLLDVRHKEMWHRGSKATREYFAGSGAEASPRRYAARDEYMTIAIIPWAVRPGIEEIHMSVVGEVGCDGPNTDGKVEFRAELLTPGAQTGARDGTTAPATGSISAYTLTLDLLDRNFKPGTAMLVVEMRSRAEEQVDTVDLSTDLDAFETWNLRIEDGTTGEQSFDETTWAAYRNNRFYHKSNANADGEKVVSVDEHISANPATENGRTGNLYELSWFAPQAISVDARYVSFRTEGAFTAKSGFSVEPQKQATGADVGVHPENLDNIVRRPKCRTIGPYGQDQGEDWPSDYYRQWSWVQTNAEAPATLDRQSFDLKYDPSKIRCIAYIKAFYEVLRNTSDQPYPASVDPIDQSTYDDNVITGDMTLRLTLSQAQQSDIWANQPSTSTTRTLSDTILHRARPQDHYDLPNTVYWSRHPQGFGSVASEYRWAWHEGQLSDNDLNLIAATGVSIDIDASDASFLNQDQPVRLDLDFDGWANGPDTDDLQTPNDARFDYHVVCLGPSWWEFPQV